MFEHNVERIMKVNRITTRGKDGQGTSMSVLWNCRNPEFRIL